MKTVHRQTDHTTETTASLMDNGEQKEPILSTYITPTLKQRAVLLSSSKGNLAKTKRRIEVSCTLYLVACNCACGLICDHMLYIFDFLRWNKCFGLYLSLVTLGLLGQQM